MAKDDTTALKRQLVALAQDAVRVRSSEQRVTLLLRLIATSEALIQSMADCDVKVRFYIDGEEVTRAQDVPQPTLPAVLGDRARYREATGEEWAHNSFQSTTLTADKGGEHGEYKDGH